MLNMKNNIVFHSPVITNTMLIAPSATQRQVRQKKNCGAAVH